MRKVLLLSQLLLPIISQSSTTEEFIWDRDEFNETMAVGRSRPSENISELLLKDYVRSVTPAENGPAEISFDVSGVFLVRVQASQRSVTASLQLILRWNDHRLRWNPADHSNVTEISLPDYVVWLPPFIFYNSVKTKFMQNENGRLVRITHNGDMYYAVTMSILATCWMGTEYFPFDVQDCILAATSPLLGSDEVVARAGRVNAFEGNDEFDIRNVSVSIGNFTEFEVNKSEVYITLHMARHSLYYVIILIVPTALLSFIATAGFFGTNNTDCITNIGFNCLLTISLLLDILSNIVPKSSELPLLGYYITSTLFLMCAGAFLSIIIAIVEKKVEAGEVDASPPRWMTKTFCGKKKQKKDDEISLVTRASSIGSTITDSDELSHWVKLFLECANKTVDRIREEIEDEKATASWRLIFRRTRFVLLLIFELVHLSLLIALLSYWGKDNLAPMRVDKDGIPL